MSPANDEQAAKFLEYVGQNHTLLKTYARNLCKNQEEADDLLQETIVRCHDTIGRRGYQGTDYKLYLFAAIKSNFHMGRRDSKINLPLSDHLHVADSGLCSNKVDALALQIDVYVTGHFPARHVGWWQLHLKGMTYQEIAFGDNITAAYVHRIIKEIKAELREEFKTRMLELGKD